MSSNWRTRDGQKQRNVNEYKKYKKCTQKDFVYNTKWFVYNEILLGEIFQIIEIIFTSLAAATFLRAELVAFITAAICTANESADSISCSYPAAAFYFPVSRLLLEVFSHLFIIIALIVIKWYFLIII